MPKPAKTLLGSTKVLPPTPPAIEQPQAPAPKRDHHGDRTMPPPVSFSLSELADDAFLSQREIAASLRVAVSTIECWRRRRHALRWISLPGGAVRYYVRDLRQFLASGKKRKPKPKDSSPPATYEAARQPEVARKPRPQRRAGRADAAELQQETT